MIPLYATEEEARHLLGQFSEITEEEPGSDKTIAQKLLVATTSDTRITTGIWDGRVRFINYLTEHFNQNDDLKGRKLGWFIDYYGGSGEFEEPKDTGYMIFWRNPKKKLLIVFGVHMGAVRARAKRKGSVKVAVGLPVARQSYRDRVCQQILTVSNMTCTGTNTESRARQGKPFAESPQGRDSWSEHGMKKAIFNHEKSTKRRSGPVSATAAITRTFGASPRRCRGAAVLQAA